MRLSAAPTPRLVGRFDPYLTREQDRRERSVFTDHEQVGRRIESRLVVVLVWCLDFDAPLPCREEGDVTVVKSVGVPFCYVVGYGWTSRRVAGEFGTHRVELWPRRVV